MGVASIAMAMEEQKVAPAPVEKSAPADVPALGVQDTTQVRKPDAGTEIRIPGLGKVGTLPKLDFGLELLYGATESKDPVPETLDENQDLTIRGSVKHKF